MSNLSNSQIRARIDKALIDKEQGNAAFKAGNNSKALALYHSVLLNLKGINNTERLPPVQILPPRQRVGTASPQPSSTQVARDIEGPRIVAVEEESAAAAATAAAAHVKVDNSGKEKAATAASDDKNGGARDPSKHEQDDANDDDDNDGSSSEGSTDSNDSEEAIKPETLHTDLKKTMAAVYVNMSMVHAKNGNWVRCKATASEALVLDSKNTKASFRVAQATVRLGEVTKGRKMLLELQKAGDDTAIRNELTILREAEKARNEKSQGGMRGFINKANPTTPKIQEIVEDKKPTAKKEGKSMPPEPATAAAGSDVQNGTGTSKSGTLTPPQTPGKASSAQKMGRKEDGQGSGDVSMPLTPPKDA